MARGLYPVPPIAMVVSGDPVVGRALALLLRDSRYGYDVKFVRTSSLSEPGVLRDVRLLVLAPMPGLSAERREALLASLREMPGAAEIPILELIILSAEAQEGEARDEAWHVMPWPCRTEELERRIEAILLADSGEALDARRGP